jgi:hypothetical protein
MPGDRATSVDQQLARMVSEGASASEARMRREMRRLRDLMGRDFRRGDEGLRWGSPYEVENAEPDLRHRWVSVIFEAADTATLVTHDLNIPLRADGALAVRWQVMGFAHNGTLANSTSTLSLNFETGDIGAVTANAFPLRLYVGGTRTVNAGNPVTATLIVVPV